MIPSEKIQRIKQRFGIVGHDKVLQRAIEIALQVAPTDMSVLITGENGSGKEAFSKIIHQFSTYKHGPCVKINCGAIPDGTTDSELFGHEKGAFTGATESRKGYFEEANGGTIFLDEIGELPLGTQARLLRVLEYGEYLRVGSSKVQHTKVRVIAATNVDLLRAVQARKFREDFYYRLNVVPIHIPPLRERSKDILLLAQKFAADFADRYHVSPISFDEEAQQILCAYPFPGNIRELKNLIEKISVLAPKPQITKSGLDTYLPDIKTYLPVVPHAKKPHDLMSTTKLSHLFQGLQQDVNRIKHILSQFIQPKKSLPFLQERVTPAPASTMNIKSIEKKKIAEALKHYASKKEIAKLLGLSERTLYRKIKMYGLE